MTKRIPATIQLFLKIYLIVILIFFLFRVLLFTTELERIGDSGFYDIVRAFTMGIRFDIVIASYVILLPFLILTANQFIKSKSAISRTLTAFTKIYLILIFSLTFIVCAADIPYFNQFFSRFSISAFQWVDSPVFVIKMIFQEPLYWIIIIPLIALIFIFIKLINRFFKTFKSALPANNLYVTIGLSILMTGLIFLGIRGRIEEKSPIRIGTAYFGNNPFLNQLGLNPNFTLIRSYLDSQKVENKSIALIDNDLSISNIQSYLNITQPNANYPILREVNFDTIKNTKHNVILIIMESMSAAKMSRHGNPDSLTPFLDSISNCGYYFENAFTNGIHTRNGVFSTLFSFPAIFRQHPMKESSMQRYNGIYSTLLDKGYSTIYFTTHDGQFDNVEGFLKANGCQRVISKADYPRNMIKTTLGVPDDYMFEFSIPILNQLNNKNQPFFATFLTASDHGPYYIPDYFAPKSSETKKQIVEYADFSLRRFIQMAKSEAWFDNTIFVFIADHGSPMDNLYEMSIAYHHTPLLYYAPNIITNHKVYDKVASQMDVFPSTMGLLQLPYYNNTFGIDLFRENREYALINANDKFGVIDRNWFLIGDISNNRKLYKYNEKDLHDYTTELKDTVSKMDLYARSFLQGFQTLKHNNMQFYDAGNP
ncbi:MAG: LTA synthase family protein [Bacteroidales bacterium]